ncbi:MAG: DUF4127 family protein [Pelosinus sp.]|nr:DUF4127 family protein [Pelosinus sp.]
MKLKKYGLIICTLLFMLVMPLSEAKTILFVPMDNRPVCLDYVVDTVKGANTDILVPPAEYLASRDRKGNSDKLWEWVLANASRADALVLSADSLVYGGLVDSRTHEFPEEVLNARLGNFSQIKAHNKSALIYVFSTVQRTPHASLGGVEPAYYEKYGPTIFELMALQDKKETTGLTRQEQETVKHDTAAIPSEFITDWQNRRSKNFKINEGLINLTKDGTFDYLILGRDDTAPYSQTHREGRYLAKMAQGLAADRFKTFPGADQLGMLMVARSYNDLNFQVPVVKVKYAPGAGADTIPSYEDQPFGITVADHITAAGGILLTNSESPDMIIGINTPENGKTLEAESPLNTTQLSSRKRSFIDYLEAELAAGKKIALADIAFANGADNALLHEMAARRLLDKLDSYSGWNTASNTLGYAISQGMLASAMNDAARKHLLAERYLDEWAYQANIRQALAQNIIYPHGGSLVYLNELKPLLTASAEKDTQAFTKKYLWFSPDKIKVSFPWNRMFELKVEVEP